MSHTTQPGRIQELRRDVGLDIELRIRGIGQPPPYNTWWSDLEDMLNDLCDHLTAGSWPVTDLELRRKP